MSRFKIGQRVVYIPDGDEYVVDGFTCCAGCGEPCIYIVGYNSIRDGVHGNGFGRIGCGHWHRNVREFYAEYLYAPLEEIESAIENLMEKSNLITK